MNIGIDIRNIGKKRTGDETVFFHLASILPKIDTKNTYYLLIENRSEEESSFLRKLLGVENKKNVFIEMCGLGNKFIWNSFSLPIASRRLRLDIYHTQYIVPFFMPSYTKIVTHIHDISFARLPYYIAFKDLFFLKILIPMSLRNADKIIAVSEFTREEIITYYKTHPSKISVIPNGVGKNFLSLEFSQKKSDDIRKKYGIPKEYFLHIGTLQPRKNIPFLLESFVLFHKRYPSIQLVLTGGRNFSHYDKKIDEIIEKYHLENDVLFLDYVEDNDLIPLIDIAQCVLSVSMYEGFGLPILESMARGVPVICSDISAYKEVSGEGCLRVSLGDIATLSDSLYSVVTDKDLRKRLQSQGKLRAKLFLWEKSVKKLFNLYEEMGNNS
ncbi:MAG: glycosyltransferase family 1 protein [Candidatus Moranbacteria bacterium]|nr:glycosyltransferase family 1 protein [Candidatus Moranbacteria bacterium]